MAMLSFIIPLALAFLAVRVIVRPCSSPPLSP